MPSVTLNNGRRFIADPSSSILDAARAAGITLEYSCRTGRCGTCRAPLVSGNTIILQTEAASLAEHEEAGRTILTCCRAAADDIVLDIEPLDRMAFLQIRTMPSRIVSLDRVSSDIVKVVLKTPLTSPMTFLPGQYIDVLAEDVRRSYSLANAPRADGLLELIVKRYPGGVLSNYWFERARPGDLIRIEGPFGTFFLRDDNLANYVFLATGTGIAPIKAILEELAANRPRATRHQLSLFWGNREAESFCWDPAGLGLDVDFHQVLSGRDESWAGARDYVQDAAFRRGIDPEETVVYACGSNAMIASAGAAFKALGLPPRRFFSDAFVASN